MSKQCHGCFACMSVYFFCTCVYTLSRSRYRWSSINVYQHRWGTGLLICLNVPLRCPIAFLLWYEMLWEFQKHGPWTNHDAYTHRWAKNNRNCHDVCAHHRALTSPVTSSTQTCFDRASSKMAYSNPYTPCGRFWKSVSQRGVNFQMHLSSVWCWD